MLLLPELMTLARTATPKMLPPMMKKNLPLRFGCPPGMVPGADGTGGGCGGCDEDDTLLCLLKVVCEMPVPGMPIVVRVPVFPIV